VVLNLGIKLSSYLIDDRMLVVILRCVLVPEIMHLRVTSSNKIGMLPYELYSVGAT
jgi:hypothetical protein